MPKGLRGYRSLGLKYIPAYTEAREMEQFFKEEKIDPDILEQIITEWNEHARHPCCFSAYHLARILSKPLHTFMQGLAASGGGGMLPTHMMCYTPNEPSKIRVFLNMEINTTDNNIMVQANPYTQPEPLHSLITKINEDMKDDRRSIGWNSLARARGRLKKFEDMDTERALTRYTNAVKVGHSDKMIATISANLVMSRKPVEIIFANTPEEISKMYSSGPSSCMTAKGAERPRGWMKLVENKSHPCAFFAYHPYIRGAYIANARGETRSRVFLYTCENGKEYYGRIYGSGGNDVTVMQNALQERGIHVLPRTKSGANLRDNSGHYWRDVEFNIPGLNIGAEYVMPFPYMDNFRGHPKITFDAKTKEFNIKCISEEAYSKIGGGWRYFPGYDAMQTGFIASSQLEGHHCAHCGGKVDTARGFAVYMEKETGYRYCTVQHAQSQGKILAKSSDGHDYLVNAGAAYRDNLEGTYYTNLQALKELGGMQFVQDSYFEEVEIWTTHGKDNAGYRWSSTANYPATKARIKPANIKLTAETEVRFDPDELGNFSVQGDIPESFSLEDDKNYNAPTADYPWVHDNSEMEARRVITSHPGVFKDGQGASYRPKNDVEYDQEVA